MCTTSGSVASECLLCKRQLALRANLKCCCRPKVLGGITNSVSFRQGTNVEFEGPSFVESGNGAVSQKVRCQHKSNKEQSIETIFLSRTQLSRIETSPTQCLVSDQGWRRRQGVSQRRRPCWRPVWSPTRPRQRLSGTANSIQRPSTLGRTPSASWPKTTRSASTSLVGGCRIWRLCCSSDIFVIFHSMDDRDSPSEH